MKVGTITQVRMWGEVLINIHKYANEVILCKWGNLHIWISDERTVSKLEFGTNFVTRCWTQAEILLIYYVYPHYNGLPTSFFMVKIFVMGRFLSSTEQVDILLEALPLCDQQCLLSCQGFMLEGWARGQYLEHHRYCLVFQRLVDGWILYLGYWFNVTQTLTWNYVCQWPIFHGPLILPYIFKTI